MSFEGVNIAKLNGGLGNRNPSTDGVMMLMFAIATADLPGEVKHYESIELHQLKDLEDQGLDESFDANKGSLAYHAVKEFFRNSPSGTLYFLPVEDGKSPKELMELEAVQSAIRSAPEVKGIAIGGTTEDISELEGLVEDVQAVVDDFAKEKRLIDFVLLQGNGYLDNDKQVALSEYPDFREKAAPNVCVSIAQDTGVASMDAAYAQYADVGAVLGMVSVRQVNENIGSVQILNPPRERKGEGNYSLTGVHEWQGANLSDGRAFHSLSIADENLLSSKGYIYAGSFAGYDGVYFSGSATCVDLLDDYCYIENNRTWNKAARVIRKTLIPEVRGVVKKDPSTGYILQTTISGWEGLLNKALGQMEIDNETSGHRIYINPKQTLSESNPLIVKAEILKDGILHSFDVDLGYTNSI